MYCSYFNIFQHTYSVALSSAGQEEEAVAAALPLKPTKDGATLTCECMTITITVTIMCPSHTIKFLLIPVKGISIHPYNESIYPLPIHVRR